MTTPEQQAQVEQWQKEFEAEALRRNPSAILARSGNGYYIPTQNSAWGGYLAGREAQQREDAEKIAELKAIIRQHDIADEEWAARLLDKDATIAQLQAQVKELEAVQAELPDDYTKSKDWRFDSRPHLRVRWLKERHKSLKERVEELESRLAAGEPVAFVTLHSDGREDWHRSPNYAYGPVTLFSLAGVNDEARIPDVFDSLRSARTNARTSAADTEYQRLLDKLSAHEMRLIRQAMLALTQPAQPPAAQVPDAPVAWRSRHVNYVGWTLSEWELPMREGQEQQPLYLDQRCAAIPDSLHMRDVTHPKATNPEEAWMYATGWNACRAAMIEGEKK